MRELSFIVDTLFSLLVGAFLLRLLFQLVRADFRNPLVQTIVRLTDPVVMPLRRVLPAIGRVDTASVVAVVLAQMARTAARYALIGAMPPVGALFAISVVQIVDVALLVLLGAIFIYVILSWVSPDGYSPLGRVLGSLVEPVLAPVRRALPSFGGLDLSPVVVMLLISVLRMVVTDRIGPALIGLAGG